MVERGRELGSGDKNKIVVARTLTRKGTAFVKMAKCSKDYEPAIEAYQRALEVHRNTQTVSKLEEAERVKKECERVEYIDPEIADEEREKGDLLLQPINLVLCVRTKEKTDKRVCCFVMQVMSS